jgi:hypothetical protein
MIDAILFCRKQDLECGWFQEISRSVEIDSPGTLSLSLSAYDMGVVKILIGDVPVTPAG